MNRRRFFKLLTIAAPTIFVPKLIVPRWEASSKFIYDENFRIYSSVDLANGLDSMIITTWTKLKADGITISPDAAIVKAVDHKQAVIQWKGFLRKQDKVLKLSSFKPEQFS